jgi:Carboxypeptidase regulatory-like domain
MRIILMAPILSLMLLGALAAPEAASAQNLPPRPAPTADSPEDDDDDPPAPGRIAGTVIDLTSGAPVPGVRVSVGDRVVVTDSNGNYDLNGLAPGSYQVALLLDAAQGLAEQGPLTIQLAEGATVVQHLAFRSPPAPTAVAEVPAPPAPAALPSTGGGESPGVIGALIGLALIGAGALARRAR